MAESTLEERYAKALKGRKAALNRVRNNRHTQLRRFLELPLPGELVTKVIDVEMIDIEGIDEEWRIVNENARKRGQGAPFGDKREMVNYNRVRFHPHLSNYIYSYTALVERFIQPVDGIYVSQYARNAEELQALDSRVQIARRSSRSSPDWDSWWGTIQKVKTFSERTEQIDEETLQRAERTVRVIHAEMVEKLSDLASKNANDAIMHRSKIEW
jgi:hypothetical protein